jgi:hypothetical protein
MLQQTDLAGSFTLPGTTMTVNRGCVSARSRKPCGSLLPRGGRIRNTIPGDCFRDRSASESSGREQTGLPPMPIFGRKFPGVYQAQNRSIPKQPQRPSSIS